MQAVRAFFLLTIVAIWALSACGADDTARQATRQPPAPTPPVSGPVQTLTIWHTLDGQERTALETLRLNFEAANPRLNITLVAQDAATLTDLFPQAVDAGSGPDLLITSTGLAALFAREGYLQPLNETLTDHVTSNQAQVIAEATMLDGEPYGVAFSVEFYTLYYNRRLISLPAGRIADPLARMPDNGAIIPPRFAATAGLLFAAEGHTNTIERLTDEQAIADYLRQLATWAQAESVMFSDNETPFLDETVAFLVAPASAYAVLYDQMGDRLGVTRWPTLLPPYWRTLLQLRVITININATREALDLADRFVGFLLRSDTQRQWFELTGRASVNPAELDAPALSSTWSNTLEWSLPEPFAPTFRTAVLPLMDQAVYAVTVEGLSPEEAASQAASAIEAVWRNESPASP